MYGIVEIKGHQYRVGAGDVIDVERIEAEVGAKLEFEQVLFVGGEQTLVGAPTVKGAKVTAQVILQDKSKKILMMKRRPGKWRRRKGHRQCFTGLLITGLDAGNGKSEKIAKDHKWAQKYLK